MQNPNQNVRQQRQLQAHHGRRGRHGPESARRSQLAVCEPRRRNRKPARRRRHLPGRRNTSVMHALNQRTREESGFVIVAVLLMIVVILLLGAALVGSSVLTSSHGTKDYAQKQALAAADAGVEAAKYRLSNQEEDTSAQQKEC